MQMIYKYQTFAWKRLQHFLYRKKAIILLRLLRDTADEWKLLTTTFRDREFD